MRFPSALLALCTVVSGSVPALLAAQEAPAPGATLTLSDAVALARRNNPSFLTASNARRTAAASVRAANGAFLPNISTGFGTSYREGRQQFFAGEAFGATNDQLATDVSGSASLGLSLATFSDRRAAIAQSEAVEADVASAEVNIRNNVASQFIAALQAQSRATLQDSLVVTTASQLQLARARFEVGSATQLDVQTAEVAHGRQQIAAVNAHNQYEIEKIRLFQQMGIAPVEGVNLDPTLPATPELALNDVLTMARMSNPQLEAAKMRQDAARHSQSSARSAYFPSLNMSASVSGFTTRYANTNLLIQSQQASLMGSRMSCIRTEEVRAALNLNNGLAQCEAITFTPEAEAAIRDQQSRFPFDFTRNPYSLSVSLSLPIFNGFRREQQMEQAAVQRRNTEIEVRNQELRIGTEVNMAFLQYTNARQTVAMQEQNVATARLTLSLAEERYRVGAISLVELIQARGDFERAEADRITAMYDVQRAFVALESATGRPLR